MARRARIWSRLAPSPAQLKWKSFSKPAPAPACLQIELSGGRPTAFRFTLDCRHRACRHVRGGPERAQPAGRRRSSSRASPARPALPRSSLWGAKIRFLLQTAPFLLSIPSFGTPHAECGDVQRTLACAPAGTSRSGTPLRGERLLAWTPQLRSCSFYSSSSCPPLLSVACSFGQRSRTGKRTGRCRRGSVSGAGQGSDASPIAPWGAFGRLHAATPFRPRRRPVGCQNSGRRRRKQRFAGGTRFLGTPTRAGRDERGRSRHEGDLQEVEGRWENLSPSATDRRS